jgi:diguanylate cyclase (GGDEF)-like protein/PAS domain S-box-containing protein
VHFSIAVLKGRQHTGGAPRTPGPVVYFSAFLADQVRYAWARPLVQGAAAAMTRRRRRLARVEERWQAAFELAPVAMVEHDFQGVIRAGNPALLDLTGMSLSQLLGSSWFDLVHPDDRTAVEARVAARAAGQEGLGQGLEIRLCRPDGTQRCVKLRGSLLSAEAHLGRRVLVHVMDVTNEHATRQALEQANARFSALIQHGTDIISVLDGTLTLRYASPAYATVLGEGALADVGGSALARAHPDDAPAAQARLTSLVAGTEELCTFLVRMEAVGGGWRALEVTATNHLDDPAVSGLVCNARDVTERVEATEKLEYQALHDDLTGLANRALLARRLKELDGPAGKGVAVLFLDLDSFKTLNDTLGHSAGDDLLVVVAERLTKVVRPVDTVARLGGDEFVILAHNIPDEPTAVGIAERTCEAVSRPVFLQGHKLTMGCSIGIAFAGEGPADALLHQADLALYRAKAGGRSRWEFYDPADGGRPELYPDVAPTEALRPRQPPRSRAGQRRG